MLDQEGYREARAADWANRPPQGNAFELEGMIGGFVGAFGHDDDGMKRRFVGCAGATFFFTFLLAGSIGSLNPTEYGLVINQFTRVVDTSGATYHGGRHLIMPWNSFITFPSTVVTVEFSGNSDIRGKNSVLATRTKDGLALNLHLSFQYRVVKEELAELFKMTQLMYEPLFVRNAKDVLLKAAAEYEAMEYWENRDKIGIEMHHLLDKRLQTVHAQCTGLQLLIIDLPQEFEKSIVDTQVQKQAIRTRKNEQQVKRIQADTLVLQATFSKNVTVTNQIADSLYYRMKRTADAEAQKQRLQIEAETLASIRERLGLSPSQMVAYQQFVAYYMMTNASFIYGMKNAILNVGPGSR